MERSINQHRIDAVEHQLAISFGKRYKDVTEIVDRSTLEKDYQLLHVSDNDHIKAFYPRFSTRTIQNETQSVMRISTSPGILYCILGRGDPIGENQFIWKNHATFYTIYGLDWNIAVKPSEKLVLDVPYSHEHWIVVADPNERSYIPVIHGQFFLYQVEAKPSKNLVERHYTFYLKLARPTLLYGDVMLDKGFWEVRVNNWVQPFTTFSKNNVSIRSIKEGMFTKEYVQRFMKKK